MTSQNNIQPEIRRITIDLPKDSLDLIENYCKETYLTRRKWFFDAMNVKLEHDGLQKIHTVDSNKKEVLRPKDT
jgi:hypothetical protein